MEQAERESMKDRLASALRIFGHRGYQGTQGGVVTLRDPVQTDTFWANPGNVQWTLLQPNDLLHIDKEGMVLPDGASLTLHDMDAFRVHAAIFAARADVTCIAQGSPPHGKAFSHLGKELDPITQDSCAFYQDNAVYDGLISGESSGQAIVAALGGRKALFLKDYGFLVAAASVESVVFFFISCEKSCSVQMLAEDAAAGRQLGPPHKLAHEDAYNTWKVVGSEQAGFFSASPEFQALEAREISRISA